MTTIIQAPKGANNAFSVNGKFAADSEAIRGFLGRVIEPGQVTELRVIGATFLRGRTGTLSGYFDDIDDLTCAAVEASRSAPAVYFIPNRVNPALLARAVNRMRECGVRDATTSDTDITARYWLLIDSDPVRPSGISSSDSEHEAALARILSIRDYLRALGWPEPIVADSGNGGHLMYRVDLPTKDGGLIERCLKELAARFDDEIVKVDTSVKNPARIWKVYGTPARKGDSTPDRPHRLAQVLDMPERLDIVSLDLLEALATLQSEAPKANGKATTFLGGIHIPWADGFDLEAWMKAYLPDAKGPDDWQGAGKRWVLPDCPWDSSHKDSAFVVKLPSGPISAGCQHNSCQGKGWDDLRALVDPEGAARAKKAREREAEPTTPRAAPTEGEEGGEAPWEEPILFFQTNVPPFPTEALPSFLRAEVEALAVATQTPPDLAAMTALSAVSTAVQRKVRIKIRKGWSEPTNIFVATALPSGNRKSAVVECLVEPIEAFERSETERLIPEVAKAESLYKMEKARVDGLQAQAAKAQDSQEAKRLSEEAVEASAGLAAMKVPVLPRILADDVTPEKLAALMAQQRGKMAVLSPEGDLFDLMTARYGNAPNFGVFLKAHSGDTLRVDRIGRAPDFVPEPALTLGLAVQPDVLRGLSQTPSLRGRGLLARFLFSWPTSSLGRRAINPPPIPDAVSGAYFAGIIRLLKIEPIIGADGEELPHILELSSAAYAKIEGLLAWTEPQLREGGELCTITDWAGKFVGQVARIAALLHLVEHSAKPEPWTLPVSEATADAAISTGHYLLAHARMCFTEMGADPDVEDARFVLRWIEREGRTNFTKRDAHQGTRGRFRKVESIEPALRLLIRHCYIRERVNAVPPRPGRQPSPVYEVNPTIICEYSE